MELILPMHSKLIFYSAHPVMSKYMYYVCYEVLKIIQSVWGPESVNNVGAAFWICNSKQSEQANSQWPMELNTSKMLPKWQEQFSDHRIPTITTAWNLRQIMHMELQRDQIIEDRKEGTEKDLEKEMFHFPSCSFQLFQFRSRVCFLLLKTTNYCLIDKSILLR